MPDNYSAVADLYDHIVPYRDRQDINFFVELAKESGGPVLELGCGTGRVLIPTARAGVDIVGLDLSTEMLAVCRRRLAAEPQAVQSRVRLVQVDMRQFELTDRFRLATIPFRPFQHLLTVDDQLAALRCIHRHLADDGRLLIDVFNPSLPFLTEDNLGLEDEGGPDFITPDGRSVKHRDKVVVRDLFNQILSIEMIYDVTHRDGRQERLVHSFSMRYFFRYEMEHLLVRAGFEVEQVYGDYQKNPLWYDVSWRVNLSGQGKDS